MKKTYSILCAFVLAGSFFGCSTTQQKTSETDYTQYVNTFIGAADNGHTFPGACRPFSMIQTSPVTGAIGWRYCSEYVYTDSLIWGFTQTHLNGTGCMDLGDILVMPVTGTRARAWDAYRSHFPKDKEAATPGYYTVELTDPGVKAELTATERVGFHRYTFPASEEANLDLQHRHEDGRERSCARRFGDLHRGRPYRGLGGDRTRLCGHLSEGRRREDVFQRRRGCRTCVVGRLLRRGGFCR